MDPNRGLPAQKRALFSHEENNAKPNGTEPTKKMKKLDMVEAVADSKQSTPLKRLPKKEVPAAVHSDFSDWDESPIKPAPASQPKHHVAEKENSELDDSFDDPVILNSSKNHSNPPGTISPKKRSTALHLNETEQYRNSFAEERLTDSGVADFPSLNDSKSEVLLTVREVKNEDGLVDLLCVTDNGQQSVVYLQDHWAETNVEPNTRIRLIGAKPWGDAAALRCANPRSVSRDWLLHIWQENIRNEVLAQLVALRFTPSQFEAELEPCLEVHDIEENIWVPQLGLKGKVDATLEVKCGVRSRKQSLELKTGKSGPSSEHAAQVAVEPADKSSNLMLSFAKSKTDHLSPRHIDYFKKWITWIYSEWAEDKAKKGSRIEDLWQKPELQRESEGFCLSNLRLLNYVDVSTAGCSAYLLTFGGSTISDSIFAPGNMCTVSTSTRPGILLVPIIESSSKCVTVRSDRLVDVQETYHLDLARRRELIIDLAPPSYPYPDVATLPVSVQKLLSDTVKASELSIEQRDAVQAAILSTDYTLIEGFPGSGS
ncbi:DNA replication factor Dna2 [Teladorsagia circumcincta]|uniref:DNA replication factor Dna2 n=1 Tax=Teladorsagia circumcincta TaxID=45464 RepID=A0A2G9UT01_TELCI|nr:DNA replication factor Dna2 [Teladorsagia circumcincta]